MEKLELRRQLFHLLFGVCLVILLYSEIVVVWHLIALLVLGIVIAVISGRIRIPLISWLLDRFERKDAKFPGQGALFYLVGSILSLALFTKEIAMASILILALGDSVNPLIGRSYGKTRLYFTVRYAEGLLAGIIAAFLGAMIFVPIVPAFFGSAVSLLIESLELRLLHRTLDDNIYIPVIAGTVMTILV